MQNKPCRQKCRPIPVEQAIGEFIHIDPIHGADGFAKIYALPDGRQILRFENFSSKNGPDLHVYLSPEYPTTTFAGLAKSRCIWAR